MEQQTIRTVSRPRTRRRVPTLLAAALAAPLALSCLAVPAHAAEQFLDAAVPFCTPGILSSTGPADSALGFYDIGDGLLTADLVADTDSSNCLKATGAGLLLELDGVQLNLTGNISMPTVPGPLHALQADTINAVLCESYYPGNSLFWLALQNANGDTQGTPALGAPKRQRYVVPPRGTRAPAVRPLRRRTSDARYRSCRAEA